MTPEQLRDRCQETNKKDIIQWNQLSPWFLFRCRESLTRMIEEHQRLPGSIFRCIWLPIDNTQTLPALLNNVLSEEFWIGSGRSPGFIEIEQFWSDQSKLIWTCNMCPNNEALSSGYCDEIVWLKYEFCDPSKPNNFLIVSFSISMFCDSCCPTWSMWQIKSFWCDNFLVEAFHRCYLYPVFIVIILKHWK